MKLSIIVPFYNMEADGKLKYCMESLVHQTLRDKGISYEILAVDDCSPDGTFDSLKAYEAQYPGLVRALKTPVNKKQGGARNLGLKEAKGEWIGFMDGDDWAAPDMFEKLLAKADATGADVVGCDLHQVTSHTMEIGSIVNANTMDQTGELGPEQYRKLMLNPCSMVIKIYKRSVIEENHLSFPEGMFYEDNCAGPVWMLSCKHFEKVEEPLYYYYQDPASTTHHITEARCRDRMKAGEMLVAECRKRGFYEPYKAELEFAFTKLYYVNTLFSILIGMEHYDMSLLRELIRGMRETFPDFENNPYFRETYDAEQKKLIRLHLKSSVLLVMYYRALRWYRRMRYGS